MSCYLSSHITIIHVHVSIRVFTVMHPVMHASLHYQLKLILNLSTICNQISLASANYHFSPRMVDHVPGSGDSIEDRLEEVN